MNGAALNEVKRVKSFHSSLLLLLMVFCSCNTEVDLYTDYKEIPIVYGMIDIQADTTFIKINRAFANDEVNPLNAYGMALISDSSNYPGKLDAYIVELKSSHGQAFQPTGRKLVLDTLTIHNKEEGVFFSPHQKLYYTTERFNAGSGADKYHYKLYVVTPTFDTVTSETSVVNDDISISTPSTDYYTNLPALEFSYVSNTALSTMDFAATEEAVLYEIRMRFNYWERHGDQPLEKKEVSWSFGTKMLSEYEVVNGYHNIYRLYYPSNILFLNMSDAIGNDTVGNVNQLNVTRYMGDVDVFVSAAGEVFNNYYQLSYALHNDPGVAIEFSNIEGGYGLFSSRILVCLQAKLSGRAKYDLFSQPWGFRER